MAFAIYFFSFTSLIPIDFGKNMDSVYGVNRTPYVVMGL